MKTCYLMLAVCLCAPIDVQAEQTAKVQGNAPVLIYSGPGDDHYPTAQVQPGVVVAIQRHATDGWVGIRPLPESYSWVHANNVDPHVAAGVGTVASQDVSVWVGSRLGNVDSYHSQLKLRRGERIEILGARDIARGIGEVKETWYRIVPPAGELRWIHERHLQTTSPTPVARRDAAGDVIRIPGGAEQASADASSNRGVVFRDPRQRLGHTGFRDVTNLSEAERRAHRQVGYSARISDDVADPVATPQELARQRESDPNEPARLDLVVASEATPLSAKIPRIAELDTDLSLMVAQPPNLWDFTNLRAQTEQIVRLSDNAAERTQARDLLEKFDELEALRATRAQKPVVQTAGKTTEVAGGHSVLRRTSGTKELSAGGAVLQPVSKERSSEDETERLEAERLEPTGDRLEPIVDATAATPQNAESPIYDGMGTLVAVYYRQKPDGPAPRFALLQDNEVVGYVTPSPGLNLRRYLGREVGLIGRQGEYRKQPLIRAERVVELKKVAATGLAFFNFR